ncbi:DUF7006 family protein [Enterococcus sp. DIV0876]|uniref:DUF7006 family protein n=1 Tax=Enterococcus sp. DIV0876 TaxID=2774633 RepID=UPI003D2FFA0F
MMDKPQLFDDSKNYFDRMMAHHLQSWRDQQSSLIGQYIEDMIMEFEQIVANINGQNFWRLYPILMGVDARLVLLDSLLSLPNIDLTEEELIQMVEKDYTTINKEFCGYSLNEEAHESLLFDVI